MFHDGAASLKWARERITAGEARTDFICRNLSIVRSRRRKGRWLVSTLLLTRWPIFCLSALPSSVVATR